MPPLLRRAFWLASLLGLLGCSDESSDPSRPGGPVSKGQAERVWTALRECGLISAGQVGGHYHWRDCTARCVEAASCEELAQFWCGSVVGPVFDCVDACGPSGPVSEGFVVDRCADGQDDVIVQYCNGDPECADGSDERGCDAFECADGETLPAYLECDAWPDCRDGSDEGARCARICPNL